MSICFKYIEEIGRHNDVPDDEFDPNQLKRGIEVEMEHTDDEEKARSIAKDHLAEDDYYYDHLDDMELEFGEDV